MSGFGLRGVREGPTCIIRAELPEIDPDEDMEVLVNDGTVHISAKRKERAEHREKASNHSEFRYGEFPRDVALPAGGARRR